MKKTTNPFSNAVSRLVAIGPVFRRLNNKYEKWIRVKCSCGVEKDVRYIGFLRSSTRSCGCLKKDEIVFRKTTHNKHREPIYRIWRNMKHRCGNPKHATYHRYGGRGITVCQRWKKFENFYEDMGDRPGILTLDRINNDKGYYKSNCRWATKSEQRMNQSGFARIRYKGQNLTIREWCNKLGISITKLKWGIHKKRPFNILLEKSTYKK